MTAEAKSKRRGHGAKIDEALAALEAKGTVPENLRHTELVSRILEVLKARGYEARRGELPSRFAIARRLRRDSMNSPESESSTCDDQQSKNILLKDGPPMSHPNIVS